MEWISVKDKLPEGRCRVIAYERDSFIDILSFNPVTQKFEVFGISGMAIVYPTHWMPLPEPPSI